MTKHVLWFEEILKKVRAISDADVEKCPFEYELEEGDVDTGKTVPISLRKFFLVRQSIIDEHNNIIDMLKSHEVVADSGAQREATLNKLRKQADILKDIFWMECHQVLDSDSDFAGVGLRANWKLVGLPPQSHEDPFEDLFMPGMMGIHVMGFGSRG